LRLVSRAALSPLLVLVLVIAPSAQAQTILLKTGQTIETKGVRRSGDMVMVKVQVGASSGEVGYRDSTIAQIAFPKPLQLKSTAAFLSEGQPEKALADIEPIAKYYQPFRDIPGNWWAPAALLKVSALSGMQLDKEAEKLADEIRKNVIDPETARAAQLQLVAGLVRRSEYDKALQLCDSVIKESAKAEVLAEAGYKGDAFLAQRQWDDAVLAYLHVPVFLRGENAGCRPRSAVRALSRFGRLGRGETIAQRSDRRLPEIGTGGDRLDRVTEVTKMKNTIEQITRLTKMKRAFRRFACAIAGALLLIITPGLAQAGASPGPAAGGQSKTLWEQIKEGGWVMFPIALCSIATLYLIGDGIIRTSRKKAAPPDQEEALKTLFRQGDYVGAHHYCKANPSPLIQCVADPESALLRRGQTSRRGRHDDQLAKENSHLQTYISYLSVIGVCTPMIGLLGTVTGMIKAFAKLGPSGIGYPSGRSAAIGEVLVATASGLVIAIPAFGAFYFLRNRATGSIHHIQDIVNSLFRKMPYESLAGVHLSDDELFAATPNWLADDAQATAGPAGQTS
jgi:biopolymer transport protein ExbB